MPISYCQCHLPFSFLPLAKESYNEDDGERGCLCIKPTDSGSYGAVDFSFRWRGSFYTDLLTHFSERHKRSCPWVKGLASDSWVGIANLFVFVCFDFYL